MYSESGICFAGFVEKRLGWFCTKRGKSWRDLVEWGKAVPNVSFCLDRSYVMVQEVCRCLVGLQTLELNETRVSPQGTHAGLLPITDSHAVPRCCGCQAVDIPTMLAPKTMTFLSSSKLVSSKTILSCTVCRASLLRNPMMLSWECLPLERTPVCDSRPRRKQHPAPRIESRE